MSSDERCLALRLEGPLQSWGYDSQYNRRNTGLMPTKSAIAGMCCAALGLPRGSGVEREFLASFAALRMIAIAIPRNRAEKDLPVRRLQDYHTVQNTRRAASGALNTDCVLTRRQYLADAAFGVILEGNSSLLEKIAAAFVDPRWGLWLGRKACIPSAPVLAGLEESREDALRLLIGARSLELFTRQEDAEGFSGGRDSIPDVAISFASTRRLFSPRRVRMVHGTECLDVH